MKISSQELNYFLSPTKMPDFETTEAKDLIQIGTESKNYDLLFALEENFRLGEYEKTLINTFLKNRGNIAVIKSRETLNSSFIRESAQVTNSSNVHNSQQIYNSSNIAYATDIYSSSYVYNSRGVTNGMWADTCNTCHNILMSYNCSNSHHLMFCRFATDSSYLIFNHKVSKEEFDEIMLAAQNELESYEVPLPAFWRAKDMYKRVPDEFWIWVKENVPGATDAEINAFRQNLTN